jgi:hypothetical protein
MDRNPETEPVYSTLHCGAAYHISQLEGKGASDAFLLYDTCCALANKTHKSHLNLQRTLVPYLHRSEFTLYRAAKLLVDAGWLIVETRKPGDPTCYCPVWHGRPDQGLKDDDWIVKHGAESCIETFSPDYWEKDSLGAAFYGYTGGIKIGGPNVLIGWRKLIPQDEIILIHLEKYVKANPKPRYNHEYTTWIKGFGNYLKEQSV